MQLVKRALTLQGSAASVCRARGQCCQARLCQPGNLGKERALGREQGMRRSSSGSQLLLVLLQGKLLQQAGEASGHVARCQTRATGSLGRSLTEPREDSPAAGQSVKVTSARPGDKERYVNGLPTPKHPAAISTSAQHLRYSADSLLPDIVTLNSTPGDPNHPYGG